MTPQRMPTILMAEDDPDDRLLVKDALERAHIPNRLFFVEDGEELMDYLLGGEKEETPRPDLILLDLNMPRKDGREALREIKRSPDLRQIPIVVLTTSREEEDITHSYEMGAGSYIVKPVGFESLVRVVHVLGQYWFNVTELPPRIDGSPRWTRR
jgi:CheY-like chemotaxis protein